MSGSRLATITRLSPCCDKPRNHRIDTVTIHTMAGNMTAESCAHMFANPAGRVSSNYAIGSDGKIALIVEEENRSWCSSSAANDHRAITIEVASLTKQEPFACSDEAMESLIKLLADVCKRNKIDALRWQGDKSLIGQTGKQNMTVHRWFANKSCPGEYLYGRMGELAAAVNKRLGVPAAEPPANPQPPERPDTITVGSAVMITGERYATGEVIPAWVRGVPHVVSRLDGGKALLGADGGIRSWVAVKDLTEPK